MDLVVQAGKGLSGELEVPPSKLYTQFATALALLAEGKSSIKGPLRTKDTICLLRAVEGMGATVKRTQERWSIWGVGRSLKPVGNVIDAKNSVTSLSLLTSIAALAPRVSVITGDAQLRARPMPKLLQALRHLGVKVYSTKPDDSPPFVVFGGEFRGGRISVRGTSASLMPALLLSCPYAKRRVEFSSAPESHQLGLALELIGTAGVKIAVGKRLRVPNQPYRPFNIEVPPDLAAAAPFVVAAALTDSNLKLSGVETTAGRAPIFLDILKEMGVRVQASKKDVVVHGPQRPRGAKIDLSAAPELLPIVSVLAAKAKKKTTILNAADARYGKSDRISAIARALRRMRVKLVERKDGLMIDGQAKLKGCEVDGCDDYAIVAALMVAGMLADGKTIIRNRAEALQTSYSRFVSTFQELGASIEYAG